MDTQYQFDKTAIQIQGKEVSYGGHGTKNGSKSDDFFIEGESVLKGSEYEKQGALGADGTEGNGAQVPAGVKARGV